MNSVKNKKILLVFLFVAVMIVAIVSIYLVVVSISRSTDQDTSIGDTTSSTTDSTAPEPQEQELGPLVQFDGTYIQAELPENWSIIEYDDDRGMGIGVMNVGYNGLTGLDISNSGGKTIFQFRGVDGVGDSGLCSEVFQFSDTDQDYIQRKVDAWNAYGNGYEAKIIDLGANSYTESSLFDRVYRRIENTFYWKNVESPAETFNPECGMSWAYVFFQGTGTTLVGANSFVVNLDLFSANIVSDNVQENELQILDDILKSIQVK